MKPCIRYLSLIIISACTGTIRADDKPQAKAEPNHIQWELNTLDAFVKAVEEEMPLVVVFLANPKDRYENQRNLSNDFQVVLNSKELLMFKGKAIFAKGFAHEDEYARRMASHLKLTVYPTVSIIEPRTDALTECYRMEGFFKIEEVVKDLKLALPGAVSAERRKVLYADFNQPAVLSPSFTEADKQALEQAVRGYETAFKTGDLNQYLKLTSEPEKTKLRFSLLALAKVGDAKRLILVAMDSQFGRQDDNIPYGSDDETLQKRMMRTKALTVRSIENAGKMSVTLYVEAELSTGKSESWKIIASKQYDQWKLWIQLADNKEAVILTKAAENTLDKLAGLYQQVARDVLNGKYSSREAVKEAAFKAYQSVSQQGVKHEIQESSSKEDQFKRLAQAKAIELFSRDASSVPLQYKQKDEGKALTDTDKKAIQDIVKQYEDALKAGDFDCIIKLTAGPFNTLYDEGFTLAKAVGQSKQKMLAAMDRQFGQKNEFFPFGIDAGFLRGQMKQVSTLTVLDYDTSLGKVVTMNVEAKMTTGTKEKWKIVAHRFGDSWRLWLRTASVFAELGTTPAWQNSMKSLAKAYDTITADILAGKHRTREVAYEAAYSAFTRTIGDDSGELKIKIDPKLFSGSQRVTELTPEMMRRLGDASKEDASNLTVAESRGKITELQSKKQSEQKPAGEQDELTKAQDAIKDLNGIYLEGAKLMNQATDFASASKIKPRFMELDKKFADISKVMKSLKLSSDQQKGLMLMFQEKMEPAKEAFASAFKQLHAERPATYRILEDAELIKVGEASLEAIAQSDVMRIKLAITIYYQANRHWPASLESLKKYHEGSVSDPWGKPYQFEIVNVTGEKDDSKSTPYVWTISQFGDGKKVLGTMPPKK
ncbi:MAG: hypothetical protein JNJ77_05100 [Planctomycetia bacterium]|nr:hypothetical protein [Planctomycetia bacterium]